ncbi:MAG TPA: MFS transporter [Acidimicrobiales bacterium]|nr:MFS transporter [Acidimicrobiales bacterium]
MRGRGREASARFGRMLRDALTELLDQRTPFGRLALTQVLATAGDTLLTVSLAGTLFFSVPTHAARGRVILYLLLTMAPFAVIAPLLGPVIDRSRGARRAMIVVSAVGRAVVCVFMARDVNNFLLFPEAFVMLVLSKVYLVTRGSIVPLLARRTPDAEPPGSQSRSWWPRTSLPSTGLRTSSAPLSEREGARRPGVDEEELAALNAHLGLLSSLTGLAASMPAIAVLKLFGAPWVLRMDVVVFIVAAWSALRLPLARSRRAGPSTLSSTSVPARAGADAWAAADRGGVGGGPERAPITGLGGRHAVHPEVTLALGAMSLLKGVVGFLTFLLAFSLRRQGAPAWWFGLVLGASLAGSVAGVLLVPRVRRLLREQEMLTVAVWLVAVPATLAAVLGGRAVQAALAFVLGFAAAAAKPAFDALVQRYVPTDELGRAFARFETRLQLVWVVGALIPVVASLSLGAGDVVIAVMAGVVAVSYATGRRSLAHRGPTRR